MNIKKTQNIMRKIYDTYATYGVYKTPTDSQRKPSSPFGMPNTLVDTYHDHMLHSYERAQSLYAEADEYPIDEVLEALNDELKYINHFKKIHILLATIPTTI
tara:strand:- start:19553 stop:19858 length:306 start_codon:yes stop_codon:yes gene_type:complete